MKSKGILHNELAKVLARVGHGGVLAVTDRGFPYSSAWRDGEYRCLSGKKFA